MATSFQQIVGRMRRISRDMTYEDRNRIKEKALEHIVEAMIELEENKPQTYTIDLRYDGLFIYKSMYSSRFRLSVTSDEVEINWMSDVVTMTRAKSEEEYFQMMCLDDTYCDVEFEKGIKQLVDLHLQHMLSKSAIGGFIEGAYDNQPNS